MLCVDMLTILWTWRVNTGCPTRKSEVALRHRATCDVDVECLFSLSSAQRRRCTVHHFSRPFHYSFIGKRGEFQGCRSLCGERKRWSVANTIGRRYWYGSSFVDEESGVRFEGHHPLERPDLWKMYLNEAEGSFVVEDLKERCGASNSKRATTCHSSFLDSTHRARRRRCALPRPLEGSYQAAILEEMASSPEIGVIHDVIEREIRLGALEVKGAWSKGATVVGADYWPRSQGRSRTP